VALAAPEAIQPLLVSGLPDAVHEPLPRGTGDGDSSAGVDGYLDGHAARALLRALRGGSLQRASALLLGPGISTQHGAPAFVRTLLAGLDEAAADGDLGACVIDADALTALAALPGWSERLALPRVLTPHPAEMARLVRRTTAEVQSTRLATALDVAQETRSVVVLKGACTIVAAPDGRARISDQANAMLATAGTGDVLAGLIAGLLAQGMEPFEAAAAAVYVHGDCGRRVAETHGTAAGLAQDLLRVLPEVRGLLEGRASTSGGIGLPPGLEAGPPMGAGGPPAGGGLW
jgi:ADP-dependent NAD(P)H-hydrate dehydratase / NAD(P)H-hydrate epimerase